MKRTLISIIAALFLLLCGWGLVSFYPYIFAKLVVGKVVKVDRVSSPTNLISTGAPIPNSQLFSFAVAIQDSESVIHTASSEDRQWAVAEPGKCAKAKFFPYPPWNLEKSGTYFNARLVELRDCP
jgi:hypothetical protein